MGRPRYGDVFFIGKEKSGVVSLSYFILLNPTLSHPLHLRKNEYTDRTDRVKRGFACLRYGAWSGGFQRGPGHSLALKGARSPGP